MKAIRFAWIGLLSLLLATACFADDGMEGYNSNSNNNDGTEYIKYWTDYQILPKRCIVYNNVDSIVFQVFDSSDHCTSEPIGTYVSPVPSYMYGHMKEVAQKNADRGYDDYVEPEVAQYIECTQYNIQGTYYYLQLGCADDSTQSLAVNIYKDDQCTKRSAPEGYDDSTIDVSALEMSFKKCQSCVNWVNFADDQIDDQFYENRQMNAPLCSTAWASKQECGRSCQHIGLQKEKEGWNSADKLLLSILSVFGLVMLGLIWHRRRKMSNKDALLEQAAMNAAGLQTPHVIAVFVLVVLVIAVFAALGLKNVTWALLLSINIVLFGYLMKLTFDSSVSSGETVIGPDGQILRRDSDDSSVEDASRESSNRNANNPNAGTYMLPTLA